MKIKRLSPEKLEITLTEEDLDELEIDLSDIKNDGRSAGEALFDIIEQTEQETDFFDDLCGLVVEVYVNSDGSYTLTATKTDDPMEYASAHRAKAKIKKSPVIYAFDSIDDAAGGCKRISFFFNGTSNFYKYRGKYYLSVTGVNNFITKDSDLLLCDYGEKIKSGGIFEGVLAENGEFLIKEDAVEVLCSYF